MIYIALILIFFLSFLSWKYIETPFRNLNYLHENIFFVMGLLLFLTLIFLSFYISNQPTQKSYTTNKLSISKKILLLGDSHAGHLSFGLKQYFGDKVVVRSLPGCLPFLGIERHAKKLIPGYCSQRISEEIQDAKLDKDIGIIILSSMGTLYLNGSSFANSNKSKIDNLSIELVSNTSEKNPKTIFEIGMRNTLESLTKNEGVNVIFMLDVPELGLEKRQCEMPQTVFEVAGTQFRSSKEITYKDCRIDRKTFDMLTNEYHALVRKILKDFPTVQLFDPTDLFCNKDYCFGAHHNQGLYEDSNHLSDYGSVYLAKYLTPDILRILSQ